jgi:hypothetical protein
MFVFKRLQEPVADGIDLLVEFSTLGEYGFLPESGSLSKASTRKNSCEGRSRAPGCAPSRRTSLDDVPRTQVIGALRTPKIQLEWAA